MISSLNNIAPKAMDRFDKEKLLFARDIVKARFGEGGQLSHDTKTAVAIAERNRPANAARLKREEEERKKKEKAEQEKRRKADSIDILERMGFHEGGQVQTFTPTLHRILNDMLKFREKAKNEPGHMEKIKDGLEQLGNEGNLAIANQLRRLMDVSSHPVDTQPWSMGDDQLREQLAKAIKLFGDTKDLGKFSRSALRLSGFNAPKTRLGLDLGIVEAQRKANNAVINIRREMARRGLAE